MVTAANVKSIELLAQEPNANSIEVRSTKQKQLDDDVIQVLLREMQQYVDIWEPLLKNNMILLSVRKRRRDVMKILML
jgi:hypothetical protein